MSRRTALWVSGLASVVLFVPLAVLDGRMQDTGGPGMVAYEFAADQESAQEMLDDWGDKGQDAARHSLWADYPYIVAYATFLTLAALATRDLARRRNWARLAAAGGAIAVMAALAGTSDAIENVGLLLTLGGHGGDAAPLVGAIFAGMKFALVGVVFAYLITGLLRRLSSRASPSG